MSVAKRAGWTLFGGDSKWNAADWTASDDRVRGGKSQSYLDISGSTARLHGNLDIDTLGGAGFASQRTTTSKESWDLSKYGGLELNLGQSDGTHYTFSLKDTLLPKNADTGREQSTISYEFDFTVPEKAFNGTESVSIVVPWSNFEPTYRGKPKKDGPKLDTKNIKRFSIMMRSYFGDQKGDFSLTIKSIKAVSLSEDVELGRKTQSLVPGLVMIGILFCALYIIWFR